MSPAPKMNFALIGELNAAYQRLPSGDKLFSSSCRFRPSETVAESNVFSIRRGLSSTHLSAPMAAGSGAQSQVVKNVGDVPTAVDDTDNLDDTGTLPVEDKILAVRKQP